MKLYTGIAEAADAARSYFYVNRESLPAGVADKLQTQVGTGSSPVDLIVAFTEATYANRVDVDPEMMEIAAGLGVIIVQFGFHGSLDGRAEAIVAALRRDSGEEAPAGITWPDPADDPAPSDRYKPDEPTPSAPAPTPEPTGDGE